MISVIIPVYNRKDTIKDAAMSVLNQTYKDIELIIVDDCSTDGTKNVIRQIQDDRVRYIGHGQNRGACAARNTGIKVAKGEYIAFHDSDDIWHSDKLVKQLAVMNKTDADVTFCAMNRFNYSSKTPVKFPEMRNGYITFDEILMGFFVSTQTIMGKSDVFRKIGFDEHVPRMQDYDLMIRVSQKYKVYYLNEALVDVYLQTDSISMAKDIEKKYEEISWFFLEKYREIANDHPEWQVEMLKRIAHNRRLQHKSYIRYYLKAAKIYSSKKFISFLQKHRVR